MPGTRKNIDNVDKTNIPIETQILLVKREIEKLNIRMGYINSDFKQRCINHEKFALICLPTVIGWPLYLFEGAAYIADLSIVSARTSSIESKVRNLTETLGDLELQLRLPLPSRNFTCVNGLFAQKTAPLYADAALNQPTPS